MTDKEMILDEDRWPQWPFLPMKKYTDSWPDCQVIHAASKTTLIKVNLYNLPPTILDCFMFNLEELNQLPKQTYSSIDEMLADGWIVD